MSRQQAAFLKTMGPPGTPLPKKRRIMREFTLTEISAVDRPAQEGARAAITKREGRTVLRYVGELPNGALRFVKVDPDEERAESETRTVEPPATKSFEEVCADIRKSGVGATDAMRQARLSHPEAFARYQAGERKPEVVAKAKPTAVSAFEAIAEAIAKRDSVPRHVALQRARRESPDVFAEYQAA